MRPSRLVLGIFTAAAVSACGASPDASSAAEAAGAATSPVTQQPVPTDSTTSEQSTQQTTSATEPTMTPVTEAPMGTDSSSSAPVTVEGLDAAAIGDLAQRLGIDPSTITVTRHEEVSWSDGSLGCPKPGYNYIQVITPGYLIVLTSNGRDYEYHGKRGGSPFYCAIPRPPAAGGIGGP